MAYGTLASDPLSHPLLREMMKTQRGKRPGVRLACLLLAAAGCFADLSECVLPLSACLLEERLAPHVKWEPRAFCHCLSQSPASPKALPLEHCGERCVPTGVQGPLSNTGWK